jgi:hypothetical protein
MSKPYFHNSKSIDENKDKKKTIQISKIDTKNIVDINILLNRVRIEEKNKTKKKFIFFSFTVISLSLFATFISVIK